jgi:hypothetical protein
MPAEGVVVAQVAVVSSHGKVEPARDAPTSAGLAAMAIGSGTARGGSPGTAIAQAQDESRSMTSHHRPPPDRSYTFSPFALGRPTRSSDYPFSSDRNQNTIFMAS